MGSAVTPFVGIAAALLFLTVSTQAKVENSDKNDVVNQNGTVQVLSIEDLNKTQYLNQNFRQGNYNYGYDVKPEGPNGQFHHENKAPDGVVYGCYGYVDPNDKPQITYYVSDSWGYRPITVGNSVNVFYPSDQSEGSTAEMKGTLRSWAQLDFPKVCSNYERDGATPLSAPASSSPPFIPPGLVRTQAGNSLSVKTAASVTTHSTLPLRSDIAFPGTGGKPGGPGILSDGGYGGEGGTGGLVSGSAAANGGPGGNGGDGGVSSGSSKANGGNGGNGGNAGVASGSSAANGGNGGNGGDGGEASGSSDASGGYGGNGGKGGSASGSSNANGGSAGSGGKGGVASGSSSALGGNAASGGDGGNASGSSTAKGGAGGSGGRGGTASGSSTANGGSAGAGGRGGNASGSSSASAGDGGSAGNGGVASGSSTANGGSGGIGGSGAGAQSSQNSDGNKLVQHGSAEKGGYSYTPPGGYGQRLPSSVPPPQQVNAPPSNGNGPKTHVNDQPPQVNLPRPGVGALLSEEHYVEEIRNAQNPPPSAQPASQTFSNHASGTGVSQQSSEGGYIYPTPPTSLNQNQGTYLQGVLPVPAPSGSAAGQQQYFQGDQVLTSAVGATQQPGHLSEHAQEALSHHSQGTIQTASPQPNPGQRPSSQSNAGYRPVSPSASPQANAGLRPGATAAPQVIGGHRQQSPQHGAGYRPGSTSSPHLNSAHRPTAPSSPKLNAGGQRPLSTQSSIGNRPMSTLAPHLGSGQRPLSPQYNLGHRPASPTSGSHETSQFSSAEQQPGDSGSYFSGPGSKPGGHLNPPVSQSSIGDGFQGGYFEQKLPGMSPGRIPVPPGIYVPPTESGESGEGSGVDQNGLGNDSGEQSSGGLPCDERYGNCPYQSQQQQQPEGIDYSQLPGAITSNIPVIFYPDCRSNAYTRPAVVPYCPSLQQAPAASCSYHQPLTMKFPTSGNPYVNVPSSRGAYPTNFANTFQYAKSRHAKRVVRRSRRNQQSRYN